MDNMTLSLVSALGMMVVAVASVVYWRRVSEIPLKWFWLGAALWAIGAALKIAFALFANRFVIGFMGQNLAHPLFVLVGGLFVGSESSLFEIGVTLLSVLIWREFGRDANRAIGIGIGAGAFEALLLGAVGLAAVISSLEGLSGAAWVREKIDTAAAGTPLFWLAPPVERVIAIACHASSRALVLLGVVHRKPIMVFWGFVFFAALDSIPGAAQVSGKVSQISAWWIELAVLPFALASIAILRWCYLRWREPDASVGSIRSTNEL
jgi:uncharacterized membrane protein YhfC